MTGTVSRCGRGRPRVSSSFSGAGTLCRSRQDASAPAQSSGPLDDTQVPRRAPGAEGARPALTGLDTSGSASRRAEQRGPIWALLCQERPHASIGETMQLLYAADTVGAPRKLPQKALLCGRRRALRAPNTLGRRARGARRHLARTRWPARRLGCGAHVGPSRRSCHHPARTQLRFADRLLFQ